MGKFYTMKITTLIISILFTIHTNAQISILSSYGKSNIGWNFRIGVEYFPLKNLSFSLGTRVMHKTGQNNFSFQAYRDKFYPVNTSEYFGLFSKINYYFLKNNTYFLQPSFGYDFSFSRAHIKWNRFFQESDINGNPINSYIKKEILFEPLNAFEHHIFLSLDIKIIEQLKISQSIGVGIAHYSGYDYTQTNSIVGDSYEFSWLFFNIGLKYDFSNLIKKKKDKAPNKTYK